MLRHGVGVVRTSKVIGVTRGGQNGAVTDGDEV